MVVFHHVPEHHRGVGHQGPGFPVLAADRLPEGGDIVGGLDVAAPGDTDTGSEGLVYTIAARGTFVTQRRG